MLQKRIPAESTGGGGTSPSPLMETQEAPPISSGAPSISPIRSWLSRFETAEQAEPSLLSSRWRLQSRAQEKTVVGPFPSRNFFAYLLVHTHEYDSCARIKVSKYGKRERGHAAGSAPFSLSVGKKKSTEMVLMR